MTTVGYDVVPPIPGLLETEPWRNREVVSVSRDEHGTVRVTLADAETIEADELLVATGRTPNTADIGLDRIGLEPST